MNSSQVQWSLLGLLAEVFTSAPSWCILSAPGRSLFIIFGLLGTTVSCLHFDDDGVSGACWPRQQASV